MEHGKKDLEYNPMNEAPLLNELKASEISVGLLINLGEQRFDFKRFVY